MHTSPLNCCQKLSEITWKMEQKWDYKVSYGYSIIFRASTVKGYLQNIKESSQVSRWVSINVAEHNHCRWMPQFSQAPGKCIQRGEAWVWAFILSALDERKPFLVLGFVSRAQRTREELPLWQPSRASKQPQPGCRELLSSQDLKRMHMQKKHRKGDQLQREEQQISLWILNLENRSWVYRSQPKSWMARRRTATVEPILQHKNQGNYMKVQKKLKMLKDRGGVLHTLESQAVSWLANQYSQISHNF